MHTSELNVPAADWPSVSIHLEMIVRHTTIHDNDLDMCQVKASHELLREPTKAIPSSMPLAKEAIELTKLAWAYKLGGKIPKSNHARQRMEFLNSEAASAEEGRHSPFQDKVASYLEERVQFLSLTEGNVDDVWVYTHAFVDPKEVWDDIKATLPKGVEVCLILD
jgi:hypothetical protein